MDMTALGGAAVTLILGAGGAWAWFLKQKRDVASTGADIALSDAHRATADAHHFLYKSMNERLNAVETELREVRAELSIERKHSRNLELHIWKLEKTMREAGITPPEREYIDL